MPSLSASDPHGNRCVVVSDPPSSTRLSSSHLLSQPIHGLVIGQTLERPGLPLTRPYNSCPPPSRLRRFLLSPAAGPLPVMQRRMQSVVPKSAPPEEDPLALRFLLARPMLGLPLHARVPWDDVKTSAKPSLRRRSGTAEGPRQPQATAEAILTAPHLLSYGLFSLRSLTRSPTAGR